MPVLNGWKVRCGCQEVVFTEAEKLCDELMAYLKDPPAVMKRYQNESVNAKWTQGPLTQGPLSAPQCAESFPGPGPGTDRVEKVQQERPF